jgi:hypothetical protein
MNAQVATAKRLSIVLSAAGQESDFLDFTSTSAKNALEQESAFVLSAAGRASFRLRRNQTDPLPGTYTFARAAAMHSRSQLGLVHPPEDGALGDAGG